MIIKRYPGIDLNKFHELSESQLHDAFLTYPSIMEEFDNPSDELCKIAVKSNIDCLKYIKNQSTELKEYALRCNIFSIFHFNNFDDLSEYKLIKILLLHGDIIKRINNPTRKMKFASVRYGGQNIKYIDNPEEDLQLEAVNDYSEAIRFMNNPTEEVKFKAIRNDHTTIRYVENPSDELQLESIKLEWNKSFYNFVINTFSRENQNKFDHEINKLKIMYGAMPVLPYGLSSFNDLF